MKQTLKAICAAFLFALPIGGIAQNTPPIDAVPVMVQAMPEPAPLPSVTPDDVPIPAAPVISPLPNVPTPLTSEQANELLAYLLTLIGAALVRPLTAALLSLGVTAQLDPRAVSGGLSLLLVTGLGMYQGVYGAGVKGVLLGLLAGAAAFLHSFGTNKAASLSAEGGVRRAILGTAKTEHGDVSTRGGLIFDPPPSEHSGGGFGGECPPETKS